VLELPLYYVLRLSDLAREGLDHSGSFRFADHIYRGESSGRGWVGKWLDARLLAMPAARSFRNRYLAASDELVTFLIGRAGAATDVLSVPCGIPRELSRAAELVAQRLDGTPRGVTFHGLDLDPEALMLAGAFAHSHELTPFITHQGDALARSSYPEAVDFITCTGFGEFLDDDRLATLYRICFDVLRPDGRLFTTGMSRHWASAYLLRLGELEPHYRTSTELERIVRRAPFRRVDVRADEVGLQSLVVAQK
jgi:SAM-dependent methyltransferase